MTESVGYPGFLVEFGIMMFSIISGGQLSKLIDCCQHKHKKSSHLVLQTDSIISDHVVLQGDFFYL